MVPVESDSGHSAPALGWTDARRAPYFAPKVDLRMLASARVDELLSHSIADKPLPRSQWELNTPRASESSRGRDKCSTPRPCPDVRGPILLR